jgi:hypothetical protein
MFALYLDDPGPNRLEVMRALGSSLGLSLQDAKRLVLEPRAVLRTGTKFELEVVRAELASVGALVRIEYYPQGTDARAWIPDTLSVDKSHCSRCGATLFITLPALRAPDAIRQFVAASKLPIASEIAVSGGIYLGVYCPNACGFVLANIA